MYLSPVTRTRSIHSDTFVTLDFKIFKFYAKPNLHIEKHRFSSKQEDGVKNKQVVSAKMSFQSEEGKRMIHPLTPSKRSKGEAGIHRNRKRGANKLPPTPTSKVSLSFIFADFRLGVGHPESQQSVRRVL